MGECVQIGKWIAGAVEFPVILDGDTGHGGTTMAVRRAGARISIEAGLAGLRIDDQPIEASAARSRPASRWLPLEHAMARYRAAVDMRNELDPSIRRSWRSAMRATP